MRVVVTGASGNVGTSLLAALGADPAVKETVGLARRIPKMSFPKTVWRKADVTVSDLAPAFAGADVVVHLAWLIQPSRDERVTHRVNVQGSARVFEAAARAGVPALVYASSIGAYAPGPKDAFVDESWPTTGVPSSFYSRHKAATERLLDTFESEHPEVRVVRLRPALIFKRAAATEIRRLFIGPFLPGMLVHPELLPAVPLPRGLRTQAVHSLDVGEAYRLAITRPVRGAFNIAAEPPLDGATIGRLLGARPLTLSPRVLRALAHAAWLMRLDPTSPGWLDMGMALAPMDTSRARHELGWAPRFSAEEAVGELIEGLREGAGLDTPPLDPRAGGRLRWRELRTGVGARAM
jgi:nucleoside-diphosphate-sugar epimerase